MPLRAASQWTHRWLPRMAQRLSPAQRGMPIAAEERRDAAAFQVEDRHAAVFDLRRHRAEDAGAGRDADDRPAGDVEQRVEPVAGQPTEKSRRRWPAGSNR